MIGWLRRLGRTLSTRFTRPIGSWVSIGLNLIKVSTMTPRRPRLRRWTRLPVMLLQLMLHLAWMMLEARKRAWAWKRSTGCGWQRPETWPQKLSRCINSSESKLPGLRRAIDGASYGKLKAGVQQCRLVKDDCLEEMEDLKNVQGLDEDLLQRIMNWHTKVSEHHDALVEAFKSHEQARVPSTPSTSSGLKVEATTPGVPPTSPGTPTWE